MLWPNMWQCIARRCLLPTLNCFPRRARQCRMAILWSYATQIPCPDTDRKGSMSWLSDRFYFPDPQESGMTVWPRMTSKVKHMYFAAAGLHQIQFSELISQEQPRWEVITARYWRKIRPVHTAQDYTIYLSLHSLISNKTLRTQSQLTDTVLYHVYVPQLEVRVSGDGSASNGEGMRMAGGIASVRWCTLANWNGAVSYRW